jgi:hypothetical protein
LWSSCASPLGINVRSEPAALILHPRVDPSVTCVKTFFLVIAQVDPERPGLPPITHIRLILMRLLVLATVCVVTTLLSSASADDPPLNRPDTAIAEYCQRDFDGARTRSGTYSRVNKLVLWHTEPGWDTVTVVKNFRVVSSHRIGKTATVIVEFDTLGEMAGWELEIKNKKERVEFTLELGNREWEWKDGKARLVPGKLKWRIKQPIIQPHISLPYSIEHVKFLMRTQDDPKHQLDSVLARLTAIKKGL